MSPFPQQTPAAPAAPAPQAGHAPPSGTPAGGALPGATAGTPRLFRGRTLEELLPQIRAALGPDAMVLRRREGLTGGVGGFFQSRFVEVEAVAGAPTGFDGYDDGPAWPEDVPADGVRWLDEQAPAVPGPPAPAAGSAAAAASAAGAIASAATVPGAIAPIDGEAFLRHLDAAVERRGALAPGATDEPLAADPRTPHLAAGTDVVRAGPAGTSDAGRAGAGFGIAPAGRAGAHAAPAGPGVAAFRAAHADPSPDRVGGLLAGLDDEEPEVLPHRPSAVALPGPLTRPGASIEPWRPARATPDHRADTAQDDELAWVVEAEDEPLEQAGVPEDVAVVPGPERSSVDADVAEYGLIARGLTPAVSRPVVLEAAAHGQPLDPGHRIDRAVRAALARRLPRTGPREHVRTMVVVGGPGAGRTSAVAALAAAHAAAGRRVLAVALGARDGGAALAAGVVGTDAELLVAATGDVAAAAIRVAGAAVCIVDTPAANPNDPEAVAHLADELRALGPDEVHLAMPGTHTTPAALALLDALAPLRPGALLMTHRDQAERPGGLLGASILREIPIAHVTDGRRIALADPARLARMVQP